MMKVTTACPLPVVRKGGEPGAGETGAKSQKKSWPHWSVVGGGSIAILKGARAGMWETVTVSGRPGVRKPSEATRALKKTIFTFFFASGWAPAGGVGSAAAAPPNPTARASPASAIVPLPMDTG